jgi:hypothetical protein
MKRFTLQFATNDRDDFELWQDKADALFECYTWYSVNGVWKGELEDSYKLEIISDRDETINCLQLADFIKDIYSQEAVFFVVENVKGELL